MFYAVIVATAMYLEGTGSQLLAYSAVEVLFYVLLYLLVYRYPLTREDRAAIHEVEGGRIEGKVGLVVLPFFVLNASTVLYMLFLQRFAPAFHEVFVNSPNLSGNLDFYNDPVRMAMNFLIIVLLAPVIEELVFRGVLFNLLNKKQGLVAAMVLSSLFFGVLHAATFVPTALMGFLFAFIYHRTGNIRLVILAHMFNNFVAFLLPLLLPSDLTAPHAGLGLLVLGLIGMDIYAVIYFIRYFAVHRGAFALRAPIFRQEEVQQDAHL